PMTRITKSSSILNGKVKFGMTSKRLNMINLQKSFLAFFGPCSTQHASIPVSFQYGSAPLSIPPTVPNFMIDRGNATFPGMNLFPLPVCSDARHRAIYSTSTPRYIRACKESLPASYTALFSTKTPAFPRALFGTEPSSLSPKVGAVLFNGKDLPADLTDTRPLEKVLHPTFARTARPFPNAILARLNPKLLFANFAACLPRSAVAVVEAFLRTVLSPITAPTRAIFKEKLLVTDSTRANFQHGHLLGVLLENIVWEARHLARRDQGSVPVMTRFLAAPGTISRAGGADNGSFSPGPPYTSPVSSSR